MQKKLKREIWEWIILLTIVGVIYIGGWQTEVIGRIQQAVLKTGIITPDRINGEKKASYDFFLEDVDGNTLPFEAYKNEVVFLNFWATWCPPCIAEMPDIHDLYELEGDRIQFVMISLDDDPQKAKDFIKRKGFKFPVYFLRSNLPENYSIHSIPTTYLIAKDGTIQVENFGMAKYNTPDFRNLLNNLSELQ